jgi:hypothetical protein
MMPSCDQTGVPIHFHLDNAGVYLPDELAQSAEGFAAPVPKFGDSFSK